MLGFSSICLFKYHWPLLRYFQISITADHRIFLMPWSFRGPIPKHTKKLFFFNGVMFVEKYVNKKKLHFRKVFNTSIIWSCVCTIFVTNVHRIKIQKISKTFSVFKDSLSFWHRTYLIVTFKLSSRWTPWNINYSRLKKNNKGEEYCSIYKLCKTKVVT